ncbi:MAG TPA: hypothetical protein VGK40_12075, partial [Verrucomicrobiae bacterium]
TLLAKVTIPERQPDNGAAQSPALLDPDDSWFAGRSAPKTGLILTNDLPGALQMLWERPPELISSRETALRFRLLHADGQPAPFEAYMGMMAHAIVCHLDGSVFAHLHPLGTISMTSQQLFARRENVGNPNQKPGETFCGPQGNEVSFPYEFPKPGRYRVWMQTRYLGRITTGCFDAEVNSAP